MCTTQTATAYNRSLAAQQAVQELAERLRAAGLPPHLGAVVLEYQQELTTTHTQQVTAVVADFETAYEQQRRGLARVGALASVMARHPNS